MSNSPTPPYCPACLSVVRELVPSSWAATKLCVGCYKSQQPTVDLVQLPSDALAKEVADAGLPVYRAGRLVRLSDLAAHYFAGNAAMARGYRDASAQGYHKGPAVYAQIMGPFYALSAAAAGQVK